MRVLFQVVCFSAAIPRLGFERFYIAAGAEVGAAVGEGDIIRGFFFGGGRSVSSNAVPLFTY